LLIFLATWGPVIVGTYVRNSGKSEYIAHTPKYGPWETFMAMVAEPNLSWPLASLVAMGLVLLPRYATSARKLWATWDVRPCFDFYHLIWAVGPCVLAYALFAFADLERYRPRYFVFCTPPLAILLALSLDEVWRMIDALSRHQTRRGSLAMVTAVVAACALVLVTVGAKGLEAVSAIKPDFRGIAARIAAIVEADKEHRYILYEASWRPTLNFYLSRMQPTTLRVHDVVGPYFSFEKEAAKIAGYDYLVFALSHLKAKYVQGPLRSLNKLYRLRAIYMGRGDKRGFMIFEVRTPKDFLPSAGVVGGKGSWQSAPK
jgi:hypothetical protein